MQFIHNDLGHLGGDEVVEVTLSSAANVKLMDSATSAAIGMGVSTGTTVDTSPDPLSGWRYPTLVTGTLPLIWGDTLGTCEPESGC